MDNTDGNTVKPTVEALIEPEEKKIVRSSPAAWQARKAGTECCVVGCNNRLEASSHY